MDVQCDARSFARERCPRLGLAWRRTIVGELAWFDGAELIFEVEEVSGISVGVAGLRAEMKPPRRRLQVSCD